MFRTVATLARAAVFQSGESLKDRYPTELINQKIRESQANLAIAKTTLASLIVRHRNESRALERLLAQIRDLEDRTRSAMNVGRNELAEDGAAAIAELEEERDRRTETLDTLARRIARIRLSVEKAHRRIVGLRQGAAAAEAIVAERAAQKRISRSIGATTSFAEAEELIARVVGQSDPFEEAAVLEEIDGELDGAGAARRLGEAGFGKPARRRPADVLARLRADAPATSPDTANERA